MATDLAAIARNLQSFYDITGQSVLHVGAGGGQLVEYLRPAGSVVGIDSDEKAIAALKTALQKAGMTERYSVVQKDWFDIAEHADLVYFEFCLHEIENPSAAIQHAQSLAREILIVDHEPDSHWSWYAAETEKITRSWAAIRGFRIARETRHLAIQKFTDYAAMQARLEGLEEPTITRIRVFEGQTNIEIQMPYRIALLPGKQ